MINCRLLIIAVMCLACKKQLSDPNKVAGKDMPLIGEWLEYSPQGVQVKIASDLPPQNFYRLRLKKLDFNIEQVTGRMEGGEPLTIDEVIFAYRFDRQTFTCQLTDVSETLTRIEPDKHCYVQPEREDYFRQFVEWCEDGAGGKKSPWTGNWKSTISCKRLTHTDIPGFCFEGNANACFSMLADDTRAGESQLSKYLQQNSPLMFVNILETLDDELNACHPLVVLAHDDKKIYCKCGSHKTKMLNGKSRRCSRDPQSNAVAGFKYHYHLLDRYYLSPTGPYKAD